MKFQSIVKKGLTAVLALAMIVTAAPQPAFAAGSTKNLVKLEYVESNDSLESSNYSGLYEGIKTPDDEFYAQKDILFLDASLEGNITYNLAGKYSKLSGKIVTKKDTGSGNYTVSFYGDGKLLKEYTDITHEHQGISFSVNVAGVKELKIASENSGSYSYGWVFLAKPTLTCGTLTLSDETLEMNAKDSTFVTYSYTDTKGNEKTTGAKWKSSNTKIAKVSSKGKIVAVAVGSCKVTCTIGGVSKSVKVVVLPKKVTGVKELSKGKNEIQLTWAAQKGVSSYQVYMYDVDLEEYTLVATTKGAVNSARVKDLSKNTSYKFKVRAVLKAGKNYNGAYSKVVTIKTSK